MFHQKIHSPWLNAKLGHTDVWYCESTFQIESIQFNNYFSYLVLKKTECYRRVKDGRAILSMKILNMQYT